VSLLSRVVLIVLVALLPALTAEIYNQHTMRVAAAEDLRDDALREARAVATELGRILDGTRNALVALAAMPAIQQEDAAACSLLLQSIRERFAFVSVLALVSADNRRVCTSVPNAPPHTDPGQWPQVRAVRERGRFAVAGYLWGNWAQTPQLATGLPVEPGRADGAVLVGDIGLDQITRNLRGMAEQDQATITVVDRQGRVLLSVPDGPQPGLMLQGAERGAVLSQEHPVVLDLPGPPGTSPVMGVVPSADFVVAVRPDESVAAATQMHAAERTYITFAIGLLAALAGAILLARRTVGEPVARILRTIALWRLGAEQPRVPYSDPRSELGRIGRALNDLLTAFERTEAELRASKAELERRVEARTRELEAEVREREATQALLQQSQKMEVIGQLTGGVAHDFNNLLTAIVGNLELATLRSRDRQRMLAFGRRQFLRLQAVDAATLLAGMADLLTVTMGPTVPVSVTAEPGLWPARADPNQLELVLLNLAINARDAMPGGGELVIAAANEVVVDSAAHPANLEAGDYVRLSLRDTGIGMDEATLAHVLEPFFTTKPAGKGSGLGLSMAHGVAAQSGGGLAIRSTLGQGTVVSVWLPRADRDLLDATASTRPAEIVRTGPTAPGSRGSILLVDDDVEVAEVAQQCLQDGGFEVSPCNSGAAALALIDSGCRFDLLIADLAMPGMNGVQLADLARARQPDLAILLATGFGEPAKAGYPVLEKPFKAAQLLTAVAELLQQATAAAR
jgi:signal transduction histidine kinase